MTRFLGELPAAPNLPPASLRRPYQAEYPGNVRELRNAVERAAAGLELEPPAPPRVDAAPPEKLRGEDGMPFRLQKERCVKEFERAYLLALLAAADGNVSEAARRSGLNRVFLHELIRRTGIRMDRA